VVIPVFNEELTLGSVIKRVNAVMERTSFRNEIIVVDACSEDRSLEASKISGVRDYSNALRFKDHI
jgi:glycosyltransferase involved in cell wall biosynthesis